MTSKFKTLSDDHFDDEDATDEMVALDPDAYRAARIDDEATVQIEALRLDDSATGGEEAGATILSLRSDLESRAELIATLEGDIEQLQQRWKVLERQLEAKDQAYQSLSENVELLETAKGELRTELESATREKNELRSTLGELEDTHAELLSRHEALNASDRQLKIAAKETSQSLESAKTRIQNLEQIQTELESRARAAGEAHESAEHDAVAAKAEHDQLTERFHRLSETNDGLQAELLEQRKLAQDKAQSQTKNVELAANRLAEINALRARLYESSEVEAAAKQRLSDLEERFEVTSRELIEANASVQDLRSTLADSESKRNETDSALQSSRADAAGLREELENRRRELSSQGEAHAALTSELAKKESQLGELTAANADLELEVERGQAKAHTLNDTIRQIEADQKSIADQLVDISAKLTATEEALETATSNHTSVCAQRDALQTELEASHKQVAELEERLKTVATGSDEATSALLNTEQQLRDLTSRATGLEDDLRQVTETSSAQAEELATKSEQLATLTQQLEERDQTILALQDSANALTTESDELTAAVSKLSDELATVTASASETAHELTISDERASVAEARVAALTVDIEAISEDLSNAQSILRDREAQLEKEVSTLESTRRQLEQTEANLLRRDQEAKEANEALTDLRAQTSDVEQAMRVLRDDLVERDAALAGARHELDLLASVTNELSVEREVEQQRSLATQSDSQALRAEVHMLFDELAAANAAESDLADSESSLRDENERLQTELSDLIQAAQAKDGKIAQLTDDASAQARVLGEVEKQQSRNSEELVQRAEKIRGLEERMDSQANELSTAREELILVREQLRTASDEETAAVRERDQALSTLAQLEEKLAHAQAELVARDQTIASIRRNVNKLDEIEASVRDLDFKMSREMGRDSDAPQAMLVGRVNKEVRRFELFGDRVTIGRTRANNIQIPAAYVSRNHAVILAEGADWVIEDAESKNGIYVNGEICERQTLSNGDKIMIGESLLTFMVQD